jgi:hypothetical protein
MPFQIPATSAAPSAAAMTVATETSAFVTSNAATAPLMAITAPTDRSTPPVAITSVMPSASNMTGAARLKISTTLP